MTSYLIIIDFECLDLTGRYISTVILDRRGDKYICHYSDFPNISSILTITQLHFISGTLKTILSEESGIVPRVKFYRKEIWAKKSYLDISL